MQAARREMKVDTRASLPGRTSLIVWFALIFIITLAAATYRPSINYQKADPVSDALRAVARNDRRYLAIAGDRTSVALPANRSFIGHELLDEARDIRLVSRASDLDQGKQTDYLQRYNATMLTINQGEKGQTKRRSVPVSRQLFAAVLTIGLLPIYFHFYLRYRLGPYRRDGARWTRTLWSVTWRYMLRDAYDEAGHRLLVLLWIDTVVIIPWIFVVVLILGDRPLS